MTRSATSMRAVHSNRGFTLVELMVALTGGLFVSVIVFAMARQGTRFYQQETRVAEATLGATIGMQRLRADIGRAGYMSSAFIGSVANSDPNLCMDYSNSSVLLLKNMRSIQVTQDSTAAANADLSAAGITPDQIQLSGAYQSSDRYIAGYLQNFNGLLAVPLQPNIGALARLRYLTLTAAQQQSLLSSLFPAGRLLRLVNQYARIAYGVIASASPTGDPSGTLPTVTLKADPAIPLQGGANSICVFSGVGVEVNVVNFYRYRIADLKSDPTYKANSGQLFNSSLLNSNPFDVYRTELIREELDPATKLPFADRPPEIVSEYAVDLKFEALVTPGTGPGQIALSLTVPNGTETIYSITRDDANGRPQRVRSVRARLSVRSREADRTANVPGAPAGRYRIAVAAGTSASAFARVRTVQTDIAVPNHFGAR